MSKIYNYINMEMKYAENPIVKPGSGWDASAVYKPYVVRDKKNKRWLLYYNGHNERHEQIGIAIHNGLEFGF